MHFPLLDNLVEHFSLFPGIGKKSAMRMALFMLEQEDDYSRQLASAILEFKSGIQTCSVCACLSDNGVCPICTDSKRDQAVICVVENIKDLFSIEKTRHFYGLYHVLGGSLSPLDGIGPDDLSIADLTMRIEKFKEDKKKLGQDNLNPEIILANNPTLEGDATASYIADLLKNKFPGITLSRIAHGIQTGGELEFADSITLSRSLSDRRLL